MRKKIFSYSTGAVLLVIAMASFVQSVNPTFLASADTAQISTLSSAMMLAIIGAIFFLIGLLIIILKVMKGNVKNGQERYKTQ